MKTIGMIGGTSWHSTVEYYRIINEFVEGQLGGHHSAKIIMSSVDMDPLLRLANEMRWDAIQDLLAGEIQKLETAGSDFFMLCANSLHKFADKLAKMFHVPILHIADATGRRIQEANLSCVALLGTKFVMEGDFYQTHLKSFGVDMIIPEKDQIDIVHRMIFDELALGIMKDDSRRMLLDIIDSLISKGARGVVLGCTEIPLLIQQHHIPVPAFDTTAIHAEAAARMALD